MRLTRLFKISSAKAISLAALTAIAIAVAIGFLADTPTGVTAFNTGGSDSAARHMPIPAQYTAQCSNGIAVHNPANNAGLVADCAALLASKETLEGTTGSLNWSANRAIREGRWYGLTTTNNRVSHLELILENLNGEIPAELGNLAKLESLGIYNTQLTGEIPAELGNLTKLDYLAIGGNQLTGDIPSELGNLANLTELYLGDNQLTGEIPAELGNLSNLRQLELASNQLTGEIPAELGNLANLTALFLNGNQLTGEIPAELGNLANLTTLHLSGNQLTGEIPAELSNLANLAELYIGGNQLTGCLPPSLLHALRGHLGLPVCSATTDATPTPTMTPAASNEVINRLIADVADLKEQVAILATKVAQIEGGSGAGAATPTPTPSATPASVIEASPTPTATPSPTPTSVAGTSGGNACIERLADSGSVSGVWADNCLSANAPDDGNAYYARFYTFTLIAAADVTITLSAAKPPYIYLLEGVGTDGKVIRDAGDSSQTSQTITASLQAGSYTIEAATWNPNVTGAFMLTLDTGQ